MRKVLTLMVVLGLLVAFGVVLDIQFASATPDLGNSTEDCLVCHKADPTGPFGNATELYMAAHDSQVGECLTCHRYEGESIHGQWGDTPESCARCHRTHSAVADDLLVMGKDALCLFCHGRAEGLAQTNVLDGVLRASNAPLRGGGFEQVKMNSHDNLAASAEPGYNTSYPDEWQFPIGNDTAIGNVTSKHTLGVTATIWGAWNATGVGNVTANAGATNTKLECVSCHDPHAYNLTYRMLHRAPNGSGVSKHPDPTKPWTQRVFVTDPLTYAEFNPLSDIKSYTTEDYSNTWIGNKTWDAGNGTWVVTKIPETSYAAPTVLDPSSGNATKVWSGSSSYDMYSQQMAIWCASCHDRYHAQKTDSQGIGSTNSGDLIFAYRHKTGDETPVWDPVDGRYETTSCGYSCHNNTQLTCVACHVAHGTAAQMTPMVQAEPWPGTDGGHYDTLGNGTRLGQGYLPTDSRADFKGGHDYDGESRSTLLRIDNRGVCQNPSCHPKGKEGYLEAFDH